jgi:hypothetical protein
VLCLEKSYYLKAKRMRTKEQVWLIFSSWKIDNKGMEGVNLVNCNIMI